MTPKSIASFYPNQFNLSSYSELKMVQKYSKTLFSKIFAIITNSERIKIYIVIIFAVDEVLRFRVYGFFSTDKFFFFVKIFSSATVTFRNVPIDHFHF